MSQENESNENQPANSVGGGHRRLGLVTSSMQDLFAEGASIWMKILGGAMVTPIVAFMMIRKASRRQETTLDISTVGIILACCCVGGAFLGAALSMKDIVQSRMSAGKPVAFPLKFMFGWGLVSILFFWVPLVFAGAIVGVIATL